MTTPAPSSKHEDHLQESLARLEAGEPLAALQAELPAADGELLEVAASLGEITPPHRAPAAVAAQRRAILASLPEPAGAGLTWSGALRRLLPAGRPALSWSLAALTGLILVVWGWWGLAQLVRPEPLPLAGAPPPLSGESRPLSELSDGERPAAAGPVAPLPASSGSPETVTNPLFLPLQQVGLTTVPERGTLHQVAGRVEIGRQAGEWIAVRAAQTALAPGQAVRTGPLSSAQIAFHDGSTLFLGPDTELVLEQINALLPQDGFRTVVVTQLRGETAHQVDHRGDAGSVYEVRTPAASGVARGTKFTVSVSGEGEARYTIAEGRVDVSAAGRTVPVTAGQLTTVADGGSPSQPRFTITGQGEVTRIDDDEWVIAGQTFAITAATVISGEPVVGDTVRVTGHLTSGGGRVADRIEKVTSSLLERFTLSGQVEAIAAERWTISGQPIAISTTTTIEPGIAVGDTVYVAGRIAADGTLTATEITLIENETGFPFEFAGIVDQIEGGWIVNGIPLAVGAQTEIEAGIAVGDVVKVEGVVQRDGIWLATEIVRLEERAARFSLSGPLTGINPWSVAGVPFTVDGRTLIPAGLAVGDLVFVTGRILPDGSWLAETIEKLDESLLEIVFAGTVEQIDPWIVDGLPLDTDENTTVNPAIEVGDLVRVTARISPDGSWLALDITLLSNAESGDGCVSLTAVVTAINGSLITLGDGTTASLAGIPVDGELRVGSVVVIVACVDDAGVITITRIIVLYNPPPPAPTPIPGTTPEPQEQTERVTICHKPGTPAEKTMTLPRSALNGHLGHGDTLGPCP